MAVVSHCTFAAACVMNKASNRIVVLDYWYNWCHYLAHLDRKIRKRHIGLCGIEILQTARMIMPFQWPDFRAWRYVGMMTKTVQIFSLRENLDVHYNNNIIKVATRLFLNKLQLGTSCLDVYSFGTEKQPKHLLSFILDILNARQPLILSGVFFLIRLVDKALVWKGGSLCQEQANKRTNERTNKQTNKQTKRTVKRTEVRFCWE
jgi:hypothetical protein